MVKPSQSNQAKAPLSTLALRIVQAAVQPDVAVSDLAALAERDVGFASRLLALVNSPVHGFAKQVTDVRHASALLGVQGMQNIALTLSVTDMIPLGAWGEPLMAISLRRGTAARALAERLKLPNPGEYFTAGLVLEMGLLTEARDNLEKAGTLAKTPSATRLVRERAAGLLPHTVTGSDLAKSWKLPEDLVLAIRYHHEPTPPQTSIQHVAWVAERIAAVFEGGDLRDARAGAMSAMTDIGLSRPDAEALLRDIPDMVKTFATSFGRSAGPQPSPETVLRDANALLMEMTRTHKELIATLEGLLAEKAALVQSLSEANERLASLAATDGLTGLLNRRAFTDALTRDLSRAKRTQSPLSLVMLDIDHFKRVNDHHGHLVGDLVLKTVANTLLSTVRTGDVVGRFGGEEFVVTLPNTDTSQALLVADRLRLAIQRCVISSGASPFSVTSSFGVALAGPDSLLPLELFDRADKALYEAKHAGRNRVVLAPAL